MNETLDFSYIPDLLKESSVVAIQIFFFISYLTLPFYIYVHNLNRSKEKDLPFVQLFYKIVKWSYWFCSTAVLMITLMMLLYASLSDNYILVKKIGILIMFIFFMTSIFIFHILQQTIHLLLFLLAIINSLKYHLPIHFAFKSQDFIRKYITPLNVFFISLDAAAFMLHFLRQYCLLSTEKVQIFIACNEVLYMFLNVVISFLTPFIYIPIMIDIRKNRHLHSPQHMFLHNYIFFQSFLVVLFKLIILPFCFETGNSSIEFFIMMLKVAIGDVLTAPLIIQLSYLKCNIHELIVLNKTFDLYKFVKVILGKTENSVHPSEAPVVFSIT
ncbi:Serpentine Receptor, class Z [Caenorhabditis elegans]|uniref:Serpentine Receptor, class Z n=1 Tax=Caenorhabditis elegans TaxID=6239 RepID=O45825_CAEEL|nr:Serpentine Receptor, class Z [Caenorhabditis elegans]CAB04829.4 Serpentine Receptor, class Z [Caenorhabditis elegans]|eukprot:NP_507232.3 Serpentine Receptor, class Z [Caenorhabditis elegans]